MTSQSSEKKVGMTPGQARNPRRGGLHPLLEAEEDLELAPQTENEAVSVQEQDLLRLRRSRGGPAFRGRRRMGRSRCNSCKNCLLATCDWNQRSKLSATSVIVACPKPTANTRACHSSHLCACGRRTKGAFFDRSTLWSSTPRMLHQPLQTWRGAKQLELRANDVLHGRNSRLRPGRARHKAGGVRARTGT